MSLNRCSRTTLLVIVVALVATVGLAGAATVSDDAVPEDGEAGEEITVTIEVTDLYDDHEQWQVTATTELEDGEWWVDSYQDGQLVGDQSDTGDQFDPIELDESDEDAPDTIEIELVATVPEIDSFSYEDGEAVQAMELLGHDGDSQFTIETWSLDRYVTGDPGSREARSDLDDARAEIDDASDDGRDVSDADDRFEDAVAHYDDGDFADAVAAAEEAVSLIEADDADADGAADEEPDDAEATDDESDGTDADASSADDSDADAVDESTDDESGIGIVTLLFYGLGVLVLVAVVGGVLYLRQQKNTPSRDPLG